jgi:diketogulonate reductase-like aldo/keto reductase
MLSKYTSLIKTMLGGCNAAAPKPMNSLNMSLQWLQLGGRRFDGADSYGIEPGIGEAIKQATFAVASRVTK